MDTEELELRTLVHKDTENLQNWAIYADYLQTKGSPRGEVIELDIALEKSKRNSASLFQEVHRQRRKQDRKSVV